jgi:branched-chain amino acid transport system permease protein
MMSIALSYITPENFGVLETIKALTMVTVGGMGSVLGSVLGVIILTVSSEVLRFSNAFLEIGNGLLLLLVMMFMPQGVYGLIAAVGRWLGARERARLPREARST